MPFLALIPTKDKLYALLIVLLIAGGMWYRHALIAQGEAHELAALKTSTDKLNAETAAKTAILKAQAQIAEKAYDKERTDNANYQRDNPVQPVRLCLNTSGRGLVPKAGAANPGNANTGAAATIIQPVPAGDPSGGAGNVGPDIAGMLSALAAKADDVSSTLREYQERNGAP